MKKIISFSLVFALLSLSIFFGCNLLFFDGNFDMMQVFAEQTSQQEENSVANFVVCSNSAVVFADANFSAEKIATKKHKDEIFVLTKDAQPVTQFWNEYKFFKIDLQKNGIKSENFEFGYIFADLLTEKQNEVVAIPNFNARTNKDCKVFLEENGDFVESDTTLLKNHQIFLYEGFDSKKEFTAISYVFDDKVLYGFLKTDDVSPNGINPVIITCIILIIAVLSIIFAWLFMKNKHVKLSKQKPGKYDLNKN